MHSTVSHEARQGKRRHLSKAPHLSFFVCNASQISTRSRALPGESMAANLWRVLRWRMATSCVLHRCSHPGPGYLIQPQVPPDWI